MSAELSNENEESGIIVMPDTLELPNTVDGFMEQVGNHFNRAKRASLECYWNIGRLIDHAQSDEGIYGKKIVETTAEELNCGARILWEAMSFYKAYPDFEAVRSMTVEWSSARLITSVKDKKVRTRILKKAEDKNLTCREVKELVAEAKKKTTGSTNRGRERAAPREQKPIAYLKKVETSLKASRTDLTALMGKRFEQYPVLNDADRTSDKEYGEAEKVIDKIIKEANLLKKFVDEHVSKIKDELEADYEPPTPK